MYRKIWMGKVIVLAAVLVFGMRPTADAGTLYVQALKAGIQAEPSLSSAKVAEVKKGDRLEELEAAGGWHRVRFGTATGWISRLVVSPRPALEAVSLPGKEGADLAEARRRASSFTTAAAARGLAEDRARSSQKFMVDYWAVEEMEKGQIDPEEALRFIAERGSL